MSLIFFLLSWITLISWNPKQPTIHLTTTSSNLSSHGPATHQYHGHHEQTHPHTKLPKIAIDPLQALNCCCYAKLGPPMKMPYKPQPILPVNWIHHHDTGKATKPAANSHKFMNILIWPSFGFLFLFKKKKKKKTRTIFWWWLKLLVKWCPYMLYLTPQLKFLQSVIFQQKGS